MQSASVLHDFLSGARSPAAPDSGGGPDFVAMTAAMPIKSASAMRIRIFDRGAWLTDAFVMTLT